jgi:hypothetical protein
MLKQRFIKTLAVPVITAIVMGMMAANVLAAEGEMPAVAFPDRYMIRLGGYFIDTSDTVFSVTSPIKVGTVIDYQRDLDGESTATIPRIDAYYRFNERHRIDFTSFAINRTGSRTLSVDPPVNINGEDYSGDTVNSDIDYTLYKVGYAYSFYNSPEVELSLAAGLNIMTYDLKFSNTEGNKVESAGVTAPLPVFGLRMGYAVTPKWSFHYVAEAFYFSIKDTVKGSLLNFELSTEYRLFKHFALGLGLARVGTNIDVNDNDWTGTFSDNFRGYTAFGTLYF